MKKKVILASVLAPVIFYFMTISVILIDGFTDTAISADAAIVLGNRVDPPGVPSARLKARLDAAVQLFRSGKCRYIIVSGGTGKEGYDEAQVMKEYLVSQNIENIRIIMDNRGNNSYLTAQNSIRIAREKGWKSVIVVTQYFHISRTVMICKRAGFETVGSAHARFFEARDIYSTLREGAAFWYYWIKYR